MQLIEHLEASGGPQASFVFDEIPDTFTDLYLAISGRNTTNNVGGQIKINASTSNYTYRFVQAYNGTVTAATGTSTDAFNVVPSSGSASLYSNVGVYFPNYASSNPKAYTGDVAQPWEGAFGRAEIWAYLWNDSAAISTITLTLTGASAQFAQYSSATLYGITAGSDGTTAVG
jgi:hypothetical protein